MWSTCDSRHDRVTVHLVLIVDGEEVHDGGNVAADDTNHVDTEPGHQQVGSLAIYSYRNQKWDTYPVLYLYIWFGHISKVQGRCPISDCGNCTVAAIRFGTSKTTLMYK